MRVEWWYDDAHFHYSEDTEVSLARLTVRNDGPAEVLLAGGETREFENEEEARVWLQDEEYSRLDELIASRGEDIGPPQAASDEELARKMNFKLGALKQQSPRVA